MWLTTLAISCPEGGRVGLLPLSGQRTVQVCKVKGHATEDMVARGRVRQADLEGNNGADETADLGRRRQDDGVATARLFAYRLAVTGIHWSCICTVFFIAVAWIAVNHDPGCGTAPDPTVWSVGAPAKKAPLQEAVCEFAAAPRPSSLMDSLFWSSPHHL